VTSRSFNDLLRSRARSTARIPDHVGNIGIGVGGGSAARAARTLPNERINEALREAARIATNRVDVGVSLDDVLRS
jgi:hypothetical protein